MRLVVILADALGDACIERDAVPLDPKDVVGELLAGRDILTERVALLELLCDLDIVRDCVNAGVLLRETLTLREGVGGKPDCVELLVTLADTLADLLRVG